jgi:two-component sensor histidine kinase
VDLERATTSLGLKLVGMLSAQIDGKFEIQSENGTRASLVFHIADPGQTNTMA